MHQTAQLARHLGLASASSTSRVDLYLRKAWARVLPKKFFNEGYGSFAALLQIHELKEELVRLHADHKQPSASVANFASRLQPLHGQKASNSSPYRLWGAQFDSPALEKLASVLPIQSQQLRFQFVEPTAPSQQLAWHYGGTGEHFMWRRRSWMGYPLARDHSIASCVIESPYYGHRRPPKQFGSTLNHVSDLFSMGLALVLETSALQQSFQQHFGLDHHCYTGYSLGGYMAGFATALLSTPTTSAVACMSSLSASGVFTEGALAQCVDWAALARQQALADDLLRHLDALELRDARLRDSIATGPEQEILAKASLATLLDVYTSLERYPRPECTPAVVLVRAAQDAYIPMANHQALSKLWPEAEVVEIPDQGHVTSFFTSQHVIRTAIANAMQRSYAFGATAASA
eukprot:m.29647 g.29647  ORF g.29647 m.29647 type:complete len:405 (-) comp11961_c0_seq2:116-1330(-)